MTIYGFYGVYRFMLTSCMREKPFVVVRACAPVHVGLVCLVAYVPIYVCVCIYIYFYIYLFIDVCVGKYASK